MIEASEYGLSRPSFQLDPEIDSQIFVGRHDVKEKLESRLRRAIATGTSMHTIIFGEYGSGKTHTLNYVRRYLIQQKLDVLPIYVGHPRVNEKSTPADLFASIINAISPKFVFDLFAKVFDKLQPNIQKTPNEYERTEIIANFVKNRDLAVIIHKYIVTRPAEDYLVVKWLSGQKLAAKEKASLGVITDNSDQFAAVQTLLTLLRLIYFFEKKYVLVMLDEMESTEQLKPKMQYQFGEFLRPVADEKTGIALTMAFTIKGGIENAIELFQPTSPIGSRIGYPQNYIQLLPFQDNESFELFVSELLSAPGIRNKQSNLKTLISKAADMTDEKVTDRFFPFTDEAIKAIFQNFREASVPREALPREIQKVMTDCLGESMSTNKTIITTEEVLKVLKE